MSELTQLSLDLASRGDLTAEVGESGERIAAGHLVRRGMRIVCSNFKVPIGRNLRGASVTGEIDIIALDGDVLCFIEVKTRSKAEFASPVSAVDRRKQRQIIRTARIYRRIFGVERFKYRYDAVAVVIGERPEITHFRNYWDESAFGSKNWDRHF